MLLLALLIPVTEGLQNGFNLPQLGWNSWNHFGCGVTEKDVMGTADSFVSTGMKAAGYQYVNVDDCWMAMNRTADGKLTHDPVRRCSTVGRSKVGLGCSTGRFFYN